MAQAQRQRGTQAATERTAVQHFIVNNFCNNSPVKVLMCTDGVQKLIAITKFRDSFQLEYQHAMTIQQAKEMAKQMLELAYSIELEETHE